jgi:kynurenine formamidase
MSDELRPEALVDRDGVKVSKSPWGPDDEIGRLNWLTNDSVKTILGRLDGRKVFDLNVDYFMGMPSWTAAGDPPFDLRMTHTPQGSILDNQSGVGAEVHQKYSYCGDAMSMYTHCGTHIDTLNHLGHWGCFWNGWTADEKLGSRHWTVGGTDKYPPIMARGVLLDIAGMHGVDCLDDGYAVSPQELQDAVRKQGVEIQRGDMTKWPDYDGYLQNPPGIGLAAAKWLCEEAGAMCIAGDTIGLEVIPFEEENVFLPVHAYMFSTAGAQIIEVVNMEEIAAEKQYEFAFLGFPMKIRGATGAPMPSVAVPLR